MRIYPLDQTPIKTWLKHYSITQNRLSRLESSAIIPTMNTQTKAYLYAAASILCWSTVASAFKLSLSYLRFVVLLFYSSFVALGTLFAPCCRGPCWLCSPPRRRDCY